MCLVLSTYIEDAKEKNSQRLRSISHTDIGIGGGTGSAAAKQRSKGRTEDNTWGSTHRRTAMGPIKFNLSAGLMVCLLTTATLVVSLVPVGHATAIATTDDGDAAVAANRKLTADGGHREEPSPKPTASGNAGKPTTTATQSCREACSQKVSSPCAGFCQDRVKLNDKTLYYNMADMPNTNSLLQ